ncbi:hypothetical protein TPHA_0C02810 [Tetrapisispora phaffii CBS 4417]|uniref:Required for respiratory growth protein 1, mitochondrial n=1 Tax=Tetrapisispora phaffii (strain ATCC 24235 / CBS 4417 / NBRC 1672 / NRRL Y-8282 / UCD 70-5) TaxID=1071381 RepID=G8BRQ8_TETPH|nr:hypothetical protein TPHA_0C02810 [Tetrapisispora phaffii CBS 4417]CCE62434.1 hypothetical protein TPHA_0C02810 [Tetrapisispora phaffii CBS 4417]
MVLHFRLLQSHRKYVIHLYRASHRNILRQVNSKSLQRAIINLLHNEASKNTNNLSSWHVFIALTDLEKLNNHLMNNEMEQVIQIVNDYGEKSNCKDPNIDKSVELIKRLTNAKELNDINRTNQQSPEIVRDMFILDRYIKKLQNLDKLPTIIPKQTKRELFMPYALHEHAKMKLNIIHNRLLKGPPPVYLTKTVMGKSDVWFIRSIFNKKKNQSKSLTAILMTERKRYQKWIDFINSSKYLVQMSMYEGIWDHYLKSGEITKINLDKLHSDLLSKVHRFTSNKTGTLEDLVKKVLANQEANNDTLIQWLLPISEILYRLEDKELKAQTKFKLFKTKLQDPNNKIINIYKKRSQLLYELNVTRYKNVVKDLPTVDIFSQTQNLRSIMKRHKLWSN